jgi:hypothetical protein
MVQCVASVCTEGEQNERYDDIVLFVLRVNSWSNVIFFFLCNKVKEMERCDITALCVLRVNRLSDVMLLLCV